MNPPKLSTLPKILIVDDIAANRLALRTLLKGIDAELLEADNGFDALSLSLEEEFALILLDVQMPDMDGFEVCEQLRANPQTAGTPVIFVTAANKADEDRVYGYLKGATDYLSKPVNDQILRAKTQAFLRIYRQNRELSEALQAARAADRAKDAFLANISHELRTPLNVVIGMAELARRQSREPLQRNYLDKVMNAGQTLAYLIDDLLDLSKIVAGRLEFERTTFRLRHVIARCSSAIAFRATEKGLRLIEHIDDATPDVVVGDPLRIEQVLMNLLSNAIKFTAAGQIELRVGVRAREAQRVCLTMEIEDSGIGMSAEEMTLLFRPFSQADPTMSRKYGGTGLGLTICKHLAEMMGGKIGASSRKDHGSTFHVALWLDLGKEDDLPAAEAATETEETPQRYRDVHILVAEDQVLNREIIDALLSSVGITSQMVANGREALDVLTQRGPAAFDLVLMDVQMPIMDGLSATRAVRSQAGFESLPIVAFTAHTMEHERAEGAQAGMSDHIGKPIDHTLFYRTLAKWIPAAKHTMAAPDEDTTCTDCPAISKLCKIDGLSSAAGIANFAGNEARFLHWLRDFVATAPETTLQIRHFLAAGSIEAARQTTHAFKGRVGMLGMKELYALIVELENAIKRAEPPQPWLERAHHAVEDLCRQIRQVLGPVAATPQPTPAMSAAPPTLPTTAPPACVQRLLEMLATSDGGSEAMIDTCLFELQRTDWIPSLQAARLKLKQFDFNGAKEILAPGVGFR